MGKSTISKAIDIDLQIIDDPLYDYGKLYRGIEQFPSFSPSTIDEAIEIMAYAAVEQKDLRFRGSGHTFNGVTLPNPGEILVFTENLDHFRFDQDGSLTAGAGAVMWDVRDLARDHGYDLKVFNGGWAGPSVGGYINAGGFGKGNLSSYNGGLWETINWIKIIDANGRLHTIDRNDKRFPWLFGSYGQLGFIVEANFQLKIHNPFVFINNGRSFPTGLSGRIPKRQVDDPGENKLPPGSQNTEVLFWYSILLAPEQEKQAWRAIAEWVDQNNDVIQPDGGWHGPKRNKQHIGYYYYVKHINFHPPLLYTKAEDFIMIGVMSRMKVGHEEQIEKIFAVEKAFTSMALKGNYRLYVQAENFSRNIDFRQYYGRQTYQQFLDLKNKMDPKHRINRHVFFD